ncbi:stathmin-2-B-like [Centruroides vittatus]|uniref:stathmin-2-B-like n=1 Tax=Centruroides vittatus TaxID=120091 RepID=UPI003510BDA7
MGCTASRISPQKIKVARENGPKDAKTSEKKETELPHVLVTEDDDCKSEEEVDKLEASMDSRVSGFSSNSCQSAVSSDSGVYELDEQYAHIVTEHSDPIKVQKVHREFQPMDNLELLVEGRACPRKLSPKDRDRLEQKEIMQKLREEGLIFRPASRATGGLTFELVDENQYQTIRRLPPILRQPKKKKKELTYEEITKKLEKAEKRRKEREEERLSKLATKDRIDQVSTAVAQQAELQRLKQSEKMEASARSREQHLQELRKKLRAKEEHANKVRKRKQMLDRIPEYRED